MDSSRYDKNIADFYTITVTYQSKTDSLIVTVLDPSAPDLGGNVSISSAGFFITGTRLNADYSGTENVSWQWNRDGVPIVDMTGATWMPTQGGDYTVTASLADYNSKASAAVTVLPAGTGSFLVTFSGFGNEEINMSKDTENNLSKAKGDELLIKGV